MLKQYNEKEILVFQNIVETPSSHRLMMKINVSQAYIQYLQSRFVKEKLLKKTKQGRLNRFSYTEKGKKLLKAIKALSKLK